MFKKQGIKLQLLMSLLMLFVIASTAIIDSSISMHSYKKTLVETHKDNNYNYVKKLVSTTEHQLNYMQQNIIAIGSFAGSHTFTQENLNHWYEANKNHFNSIFIADEEGIIKLISPEVVQFKDFSEITAGVQIESDVMKKALAERKPFISQPYDATSGQLITLISAPIINDETGDYQGVIGGTIHIECDNVLKCILGNHHFEREDSYVYVVDQTGTLIYHPKDERIGENVLENTVVQKVTKGESGSEKVINTVGKEFYASYAQVEGPGWGVVVQTPIEVVQKPLKSLLWRIILLSVPSLLIILFISSFIVSRITKPLNQLANFSETAMAGSTKGNGIIDLPVASSFVYEVRQLYKQVRSYIQILNEQANLDGLTNLYNRRMLNKTLSEWLNCYDKFSVIMIDIDFFKRVNDQYGHIVGDHVLQYLAQTMKSVSGKDELCFRYGGEEFTILVKNKTEKEVYKLAEKLRSIIKNTNSPTGKPINISLGIASNQKEDTKPEQLIKRADAALYKSKRTGRNKTTIYTDEIPL